MILPLIYYGNPILRERSQEVKEITEEIKKLISDMVETMDANNGCGLAAIQIGKPYRLFILRPVIEDENGEAILGDVEVYLNPKITNTSEKSEILSEGCLSIPKLHAEVERPYSLHIEALNINGKSFSQDVEGFIAREIMHENDHLNGVLYIDRIPSQKRKEMEPLLRDIKDQFDSSHG